MSVVASALVAGALVAGCGAATAPARAPAPRISPRAEVDLIATTCARITSCARAHDPRRLRDPGACVDAWLAQADFATVPRLRKCVNDARSCADVEACVRAPAHPRVAALCKGAAAPRSACDGNWLVTCSGDPADSEGFDCASIGAACGEHHDAGGLLVNACLSPALCPSEAPAARCDGAGAIVTCVDGAVTRTACPEGWACDDHDVDPDGAASCVPPGRLRCTSPGAKRCEGDTLVECTARGHVRALRVTDCAARGLVCSSDGGAPRCLVARVAACERRPARCEGDTLVFCAAGAELSVPCREAGLARCSATARGPEAACVPGDAVSAQRGFAAPAVRAGIDAGPPPP